MAPTTKTTFRWNESETVAFWNFVVERHAMFVRRVLWKTPPPWTSDPVLTTLYTTNIFRELDRLTRYLIVKILPHAAEAPVDTFFNTLLYRIFTWPPTYEALGGFQLASAWDPHRSIKILTERQESGERVFTGAFRVSQRGAPSDWSKVQVVVNRLDIIRRQLPELYARLRAATSPAHAFDVLRQLPGLGGETGFMAYEIYSDCLLGDHPLLPFTEDDFVNVGPGAIEGLRLLLGTDNLTQENAAAAVRELRWGQEAWLRRADLLLQGPVLTLRNVEHSLCEYQKVARARRGERPKRRYDTSRANTDLTLWDTIPTRFHVPAPSML